MNVTCERKYNVKDGRGVRKAIKRRDLYILVA